MNSLAPETLRPFLNRTDAFGTHTAKGYSAARRPLTDAHLRAHLKGDVRLGAYALAPDDTCRWGVIDVDKQGVVPVLALHDQLERLGVPFAVERSKSKGHHVWIFLEAPVLAWKLRSLLLAVAKAAGWADLEIFPKQNRLVECGKDAPLGNFVNLPWFGMANGHPSAANHFVDLQHGWKPYADQLAFFRSLPRLTLAQLDSALAVLGITEPPAPGGPSPENPLPKAGLPDDEITRLLRGVDAPHRHHAALTLAGHYAALLGPDRQGEIEEILRAWCGRCTPPADWGNVQETIQHAVKREAEKRATGEGRNSDGNDTGGAHRPVLTAERDGDDIVARCAAMHAAFRFGSLREGTEGVHAEVIIQLGGRDVHWSRLNLASTRAREDVAKRLAAAHRGCDWRAALDQACRLAADTLRAGAPFVVLRPASAATARYCVDPLVPLGETSVIFGDGGSGKSYLSLGLGLAVALGLPLSGGIRAAQRAKPMILDWESCQEEHEARLLLFTEGLGVEAPEIIYRPMTRALADDIGTIRAEVARRGVGFVIVDSLAPACGAEPEGADANIRVYNALRTLAPATRLVLAHVSKAAADNRVAPGRPFGSVFVQNLARSVWEIRRSGEEEDDLLLALYHRKTNSGRLHRPLGLRLTFGDDGIRIQGTDPAKDADLATGTSVTYRILRALAGGPLTVSDLAGAAGATEATVARLLRRLREEGKVMRVEDGRWALVSIGVAG